MPPNKEISLKNFLQIKSAILITIKTTSAINEPFLNCISHSIKIKLGFNAITES